MIICKSDCIWPRFLPGIISFEACFLLLLWVLEQSILTMIIWPMLSIISMSTLVTNELMGYSSRSVLWNCLLDYGGTLSVVWSSKTESFFLWSSGWTSSLDWLFTFLGGYFNRINYFDTGNMGVPVYFIFLHISVIHTYVDSSLMSDFLATIFFYLTNYSTGTDQKLSGRKLKKSTCSVI